MRVSNPLSVKIKQKCTILHVSLLYPNIGERKGGRERERGKQKNDKRTYHCVFGRALCCNKSRCSSTWGAK